MFTPKYILTQRHKNQVPLEKDNTHIVCYMYLFIDRGSGHIE